MELMGSAAKAFLGSAQLAGARLSRHRMHLQCSRSSKLCGLPHYCFHHCFLVWVRTQSMQYALRMRFLIPARATSVETYLQAQMSIDSTVDPAQEIQKLRYSHQVKTVRKDGQPPSWNVAATPAPLGDRCARSLVGTLSFVRLNGVRCVAEWSICC